MSSPQLESVSRLRPVEAQVLAALAGGKTISQAARDAGIHRSTIHNWIQQNPAFTVALQQNTSRRNGIIVDHLFDLIDPALDTLRELLTAPGISDAVRLRALRLVLDCAKSQTTAPPEPAAPIDLPVEPQVARNALCPCGSGQKFKRCCGIAAPPILHSNP